MILACFSLTRLVALASPCSYHLARLRARLEIVSSGLAATLLEGCRTGHSALKLHEVAVNIQAVEEPTCNIAKHSECTTSHKRSLEALNRTMKDLRNDAIRFGGSLVLLSDDFRQTLPVIPRQLLMNSMLA